MKIMSIYLALVAGMISIPLAAHEELGRKELHRLVMQGEILPLEEILKRYPEEQYGKLLDLEVEREEGGRVEYELEFLNADGRVREIKVDASSGTLLVQEIEN